MIAQGDKLTFEHAIKGIRAMPAKGGNPDLEDVEVQRAVVFMANKVGAGWKEPAAPTAAAATATMPAVSVGGERSGEQVVAAACGKCHQTGEGGAPRIGDRAAWTKRVKSGYNIVVQSALRGHAGMPARGGLAELSDVEVRRAVEYMMNSGAAAATVAPTAVAVAPGSGPGDRQAGRQEALRHVVHGVPCRGRRRRAEVRRQGRVGARASRPASTRCTPARSRARAPMPAKGGNAALTDADVKAAVDYMVSAAK